MSGTLPEPFAGWFAARGWAPREHQLAMLEAAQAGQSALLIAPTGGGKTLAGFLPSLVALATIIPIVKPTLHTLYISPAQGARHRYRPQPHSPRHRDGICPSRIETRTGDTPARMQAPPPARQPRPTCC